MPSTTVLNKCVSNFFFSSVPLSQHGEIVPCAHTASETLLDHCLCKRHWTGVPGPIPRDLESQGPRRRDCRSPALASSIDVPLLWMASFIVSRKQALNTYAEWKRNALCRCGFSQSAWFSVAESEMKRDLCLLHPLPKKKKKVILDMRGNARRKRLLTPEQSARSPESCSTTPPSASPGKSRPSPGRCPALCPPPPWGEWEAGGDLVLSGLPLGNADVCSPLGYDWVSLTLQMFNYFKK